MPSEKILFVVNSSSNDERVNEYYQLSKEKYDCSTAGSIEQAKSIIESQPIDLVLSSHDLPDGVGSELHSFIYNKYPNIIRFLYTEKNDKNIVLQSSNFVHQFMDASCSPEQIVKTIDNSLNLRNILANKELHARIAKITNLPSPPEIYNQLMSEIQSSEPSIRIIANLIKNDISITAKVLHMVNSAFFGLSTHVESPLHAVNLLGINTIQTMVLTAGVFSQFKDPCIPGYSLDSIYSNSLAVGTSSRHLANAFGLITKHTEDALMAGMLHDIGKLVMLSHFPEEFKKSVQLSADESIPLFEAEQRVIGVTDAEIGAHLLSLWGLPSPILEAIALHYKPISAPSPMTNVLTAVHLGYALNHDIQNNIRETSRSAVDMEYLNQLGLGTNLESLKNFCMAATA